MDRSRSADAHGRRAREKHFLALATVTRDVVCDAVGGSQANMNELKPHQNWLISGQLNAVSLESILCTLRSEGEVRIKTQEGTVIPSLSELVAARACRTCGWFSGAGGSEMSMTVAQLAETLNKFPADAKICLMMQDGTPVEIKGFVRVTDASEPPQIFIGIHGLEVQDAMEAGQSFWNKSGDDYGPQPA
jgi:hypothetical protein